MRWKIDQLGWWGEFIVRIASVDADGTVTALHGGPVLGDGKFDSTKLRRLGIGGRLRVLFDRSQCEDVPRWIRLMIWNYKCGKCGFRSPQECPCPRCDHNGFHIHGLGHLWCSLYMTLWLANSNVQRKSVLLPIPVRSWLSAFGRYLWCNEWKATR